MEGKLQCTIYVYNKLELLHFLEGGKSASFLLVKTFRQSNRNSKGSEKIQNSRVEEGLMLLEFGAQGGRVFWNFQRQGGVKMFTPSMIGYGYSLNHPLIITKTEQKNITCHNFQPRHVKQLQSTLFMLLLNKFLLTHSKLRPVVAG